MFTDNTWRTKYCFEGQTQKWGSTSTLYYLYQRLWLEFVSLFCWISWFRSLILDQLITSIFQTVTHVSHATIRTVISQWMYVIISSDPLMFFISHWRHPWKRAIESRYVSRTCFFIFWTENGYKRSLRIRRPSTMLDRRSTMCDDHTERCWWVCH